MISNSFKVYSRIIRNNMRKETLNYYYYMDNGTWLCEKTIIYQASNNCLSKFMQSYKFTKNKAAKKGEETWGK